MKTVNTLFFITLTFMALGFGNAYAQQNLAQQTYTIFEQSCLNCHGEHGAYTEEIVIEHLALIETGTVVPGKPLESELYRRLLEGNPAKRMPLGQPQLSAAAILTVGNWIQAGAPDWKDTSQAEGRFITPEEMLDSIQNHVSSLSPFDRPFARYFTITHLYNAGETTEALHAYQRALSKLVNSLSWGREVIKPQPIDPVETIFYIDLRDYEWEIGTNRWTLIEQMYPYGIEFNAPTQTNLHEKLTNLRQAMNCEVPFIHVDWFLATAALPPLYHDILGLPETDRELETRLEVNVVENIRNAAGKRVWRAGFSDSGVSNHNRVVERHTSRYGAYWKSYDFAGSVGTQNIFTHPLSFTHDGGEIIFNLPNGLQAYLLVDAGGNRLDAAPISIVSNPAASDPTVRNGHSCIGCHTEGMKTFEDGVRAVVEKNPNPPFDKARALQLYTEQSVMDGLVLEDTKRYQRALEAAGDVFGGIEPVQRFYEAFQGPLGAAHAAAAVGLETEAFLQRIQGNAGLQNLGLLVLEDGTMKRDTWTEQFSEVIVALGSPDSTVDKPVVPRAERIPGESVYIPDANLRVIITETLEKAPNASITVEEMEGLRRLHANHSDIENLAGLELATNLTDLIINNNRISDLSPIAGLINLHRIRLSDNFISDLSVLSKFTALKEVEIGGESTPDLSVLSGLINLEQIEVTNTSISDLSPLAGLTKLKHLKLVHNPISDLSPLAGLTSLETLEVLYAENPNLAPLKGLTSLKELSVARSAISDVSSLAGLINLESLSLFDNRHIQDISPLASLHNLKRLNLAGNEISDVSPLASLQSLERLEIQQNNISDISSLDGIRPKTKVLWYENPGFPSGGPKIEGPWLWVMLPGEDFAWNDKDWLAHASDGTVTELEIATTGATEGASVGSSVWTSHRILPQADNIHELVDSLGWRDDMHEDEEGFITGYNAYGSIRLYSQQEQQTKMLVGTDDAVKVWLNGQLIADGARSRWRPRAVDYKWVFPVTLKAGVNVLLVAVDNHWGDWTGFFGFDSDAEYAVISPGTGLAFSTDITTIRIGDTFTVHVNAEKVTDLAGWQFDLSFDPDVLKVVDVNEGGFLKRGNQTTFFQQGTIDNTAGSIVGLSAALISKSGVTGSGTLLSVRLSAKADGNSQIALHNFQLGSKTGEAIPAAMYPLTITVESKPAWDVNADGQVSILDLILIAQNFGEATSPNSRTDVNRDGVVSILDLILVAQHMGESTEAAAPFAIAIDNVEGLDPMMIQAWIEHAQVEDDGSVAFQKGIAYLQSLLALLLPQETTLLPNYPNPFNPETWIPYQLANASEVTITIYDVRGTRVRQLNLGHQHAGYYTSRSRAAYWNGRNEIGERGASGLYFYQLRADDTSLLRKMLILK